MKRASMLLTLVLLGLLVAAPSAQAAPQSPFTGNWIGTDPPEEEGGDGSTLYLSISGGPAPRISFTDLYGSICVNNDAPSVVFSSTLVGSVAEDTLDAAFRSARCGSVYFDWLVGVGATYTYDPVTDTLSDGFATFYRR